MLTQIKKLNTDLWYLYMYTLNKRRKKQFSYIFVHENFAFLYPPTPHHYTFIIVKNLQSMLRIFFVQKRIYAWSITGESNDMAWPLSVKNLHINIAIVKFKSIKIYVKISIHTANHSHFSRKIRSSFNL